jgi:nucleotide-binding universal stress UspA family protein
MTVSAPSMVGFERILVPTDFSDVSLRALEYAKCLARLNDATILVAHASEAVNPVIPPEVIWYNQISGEQADEERLHGLAAELTSEGFHAGTAALAGSVQTEILALAERENSDLIVMGTHGRSGLSRFFHGSETESLFRRANCPILAVGPQTGTADAAPWRPREILCACDFDPDSAPTVAYAHRLAQSFGARLTILHVEDSEVHTSTEVKRMRFEFALTPLVSEGGEYTRPSYLSRVLMIGYNLGATIADVAVERQTDLIVIGAHGATPAQTHLPRGIAAQVISKAPCPVMVLHR